MIEKPIIFNTGEVQAVLDGRKTQTRRVVKNPPHCPVHGIDPIYENGYLRCKGCDHFGIKPLYQCEDILYVRETWRITGVQAEPYGYKANNEDFGLISEYGDVAYKVRYKYRPSTHMPHEAARIFLRITDVRAERLQDITPADVRKEGIAVKIYNDWNDAFYQSSTLTQKHIFTEATYFDENSPWWCAWYSDLWDSYYAKRGYSWDSNCWVWVYEFERIDDK